MFKLNVFLLRFFRDMVEHSAFESFRLQMFYEISVFETLAKFTGKNLCWSHYLISCTRTFL